MDPDALYDVCLPILKDEALEDEDKTEKLEELVRKETSLTGKSLENTVLDVLWRFRNAGTPSTSPTTRHTVVRRNSPAPWQVSSRSATPGASSPRSLAASPAPQSTSLGMRPALFRMKSSYTSSPFTSPKASPRPTYAAPQMARSSSLNAVEQNDYAPHAAAFDDFGNDQDWQGSDDGASITSSAYTGDLSTSAGGDWVNPQMMEMSPYDILRSVLRDERSDEEIERVLEANGYDLSAAIASLMESHNSDTSQIASSAEQDKTFLVGKSMAPTSRPITPAGQAKTPVICRYWLSTGQCLRADCRFSHDLSSHVCKYWLAGNCLAGDSCIFSHDPSALMGNLSLNNASFGMTPPIEISPPNYQLQDYNSFPSLQSQSQSPGFESSLRNLYATNDAIAPPPGFSSRPALAPEFIPSQPQSRPNSSHQPAGQKLLGGSDDGEAFPSLGAAAIRGGRKHHGKRGHGHGHRESGPSSLADVVRIAPSGLSPVQTPRRSLRRPGSYSGTRENGAAAQAIPPPEHIPWLETGDRANKAYLKARQEAIRHGGARNKFLQSAAQAWNRNDVRAAKALSLRGQSENDLMRDAHREAARHLYEDRNQHSSSDEVFIDLHGLHPAEAVSYLASALTNQRSTSALHRDTGAVLYAIVGTGHHSKNGRDKVGKAIRAYLNECRYAFKEFSVPGDRGGSGGILGIDASSGDMGKGESESIGGAGDESTGSPKMQHGKVRILKAEEARGIGV